MAAFCGHGDERKIFRNDMEYLYQLCNYQSRKNPVSTRGSYPGGKEAPA
jgi:hypothetical protein